MVGKHKSYLWKKKIPVGNVYSFIRYYNKKQWQLQKKNTNQQEIQLSIINISYFFPQKNSGLTTYEDYPFFMTFRYSVFFIIIINE